MYSVGRIGSYITRGVSTVSGPFHPFGGAVDIIVVEQPDGSFKSSPWYVRFGKFQGVLKAKEKIVNISVNGVEADIHMYLDQRGEAYFLEEAAIDGEESEPYTSSSSSCDETDRIVGRRPLKSNSFNFKSKGADLVEFSSTKIVERTNSQRSRILGLVFGRRLLKADSFDGKDGDPGVDRVDSLERAEIAADLLEMRWSTNIPSKNYRKGGGSRFGAPITFDSESKADEVMATIDDNSIIRAYSDDSAENTSKSDATEVALNLGEVDVNMQFDEHMVSDVSVDDDDNTRELPHQEACDKHDEVSVDRVTISETHGEVVSEVISCTEEYVGDSVNQEVNSSMVIAEDTGMVLTTADLVEFEESETNTFNEYCPDKIQVDFVDGDFANGKASNSQLQYLEFHERADPAFATADEISLEVSALVKSGLYPQGETIELQEGNLEVDHRHCDSQTVPLSCSLRDLRHEDPAETKCSFPEASETTNEVEIESISYISGPTKTVYLASDVNISKDDLSKELQLNTFDSYSPGSNGVDDVLSKSPRALSQQSSEGEQFQLSDIDGCKPIKSAIARTASTDSVNQGTPLQVSMGSSEQTDASDQESSTEDENSKGKRENVSSAINIITGQTIGSEEGMTLAESLPNLRSQHGSFESCEPDHLLAHSLDSNYKSLEFSVHRQDGTSCINSDNVKMENLGSREIGTGDNNGLAYKKIVSIDPSVEVSLCRHLLYEGMGSEAASQIFDAAKLDIDSFSSLGPSFVNDDRLVVRFRGLYFPWDASSPIALGMVSFGSDEIFEPKGMIAVDKNERPSESLSSKAIVPAGGSWRWPFLFKRHRSRKVVNDGRNLVAGNVIGRAKSMAVRPPLKTNAKRMVRVMMPTSDQLVSLNLKEGCNSIAFSFCTAMLGMQQVDARIYLWKWNTQVIISDVDGTITKSDVLGQFMPMVGMDWSQMGVAHLYSAIKKLDPGRVCVSKCLHKNIVMHSLGFSQMENGYQLLFLSARAISQAYHTRQFLFNLKQDGKSLPDGPVVISPDGLFPSLYREVIRRAPHEFKIATLQDIRDLFPADHNPFYAGFGNRITDEISYLKVGIPKGKIFTINPKGEIAVNKHINTRSYTTLHALVNGMFPPITSFEQEDFNSWNYWKLPPPDIDI